MNVCYGIKPNVSGFEVISKWMFHDTGLIWVSCEHLEKANRKKTTKKQIEKLRTVYQFYIQLRKEVTEEGEGRCGGHLNKS